MIAQLLAVVMVVSILPAAGIVAFAENADGNLTIGNDDPAGTVYTVNGPEDWATVAEASSSGIFFNGKTVRLGNDISGVTTTLFSSFAGTFDGNGKTVSDSAVSGSALIANVAFYNAKIKNVTLSNVTVNANTVYAGSLVGEVIYSAITSDTQVEISNITLNNVTVSSSAAGSEAVGGLVGYMNPNKDCVIDGIAATNLKVSANIGVGGSGGLIGYYAPSDSNTLTVKNVKVEGLDMDTTFQQTELADKSSPSKAILGTMGVGGIIGLYVANAASGLNITDVMLDGYIDTARPTSTCEGSTAGLIGFVTEKGAMAYSDFDNYAGNITIKRVEMLVDVVSSVLYNGGTAALIGNYGQQAGGDWETYRKDLYAEGAVLDIEDVYVGGNVTGSAWAGGVMGYASFTDSTVNVNNVVFAGSITNPTAAAQAALIITRGNRLGMKVTVKNCSAVNTALPLTHDMGNMGSRTADMGGYTDPTITINGIGYMLDGSVSGLGRYSSLQRDAIITVTTAEAKMMVQYTDAGFIKKVDGHLAGDYEQHTGVYPGRYSDSVYDIRFITVSHVDNIDNYTVSIMAKTADGTFAFDNLVCKAYESLVGYNGMDTYNYTPAQFGGRRFAAVLLQQIPSGVDYGFEVTVSYVTQSGVEMADVNTLYVTADGKFGSTPISFTKLLGAELSEYRIVYPENGSYTDKVLAAMLSEKIKELTGITLDVASDSETAHEREILCGNTNRKTEESLDAYGYSVTGDGEYVLLSYGSYEAFDGILDSVERWFGKNALNISGRIPEDNNIVKNSGEIRVMTSNVLFGTDTSLGLEYDARAALLSDIYLEYKPDFIGLQEAATANNMGDAIKDNLSSEYSYISPGVNGMLPILYRKDEWKISTKTVVMFWEQEITGTETFDDSWCWGYNWVMFERTSDSSEKVIVMNLHFHPDIDDYRDSRTYDMNAFNTEIKNLQLKYKGVPIVITGDYNTTVTHTRCEGLEDGWAEDIIDDLSIQCGALLTEDSRDTQKTSIDHICVTYEQVDVIRHRRVYYEAMKNSSDHTPYFVDIVLK